MNKKLAKIFRRWADRLDPQYRVVFNPGTSYSLTIHGGAGGASSGKLGTQGGSAKLIPGDESGSHVSIPPDF